MHKTVTLVEINIHEEMIPLVSGYLQSYACRDTAVRDSYEFIKYSTSIKTSLETIIESIFQFPSDIYAFSCYIWNTHKVQKIISRLIEVNPHAYIILGGPHVMHQADKYLDPSNERMVICNGEGEITFANFIKACLDESPDFSDIRGLSYYRDGLLITTPQEERIKDLDDIPSPFNSEIFNGKYIWSIIETNRGCPFQCSYCFWGAATNDRVNRFSDERVRQDLRWLSENGIPCILIADANWGIFQRDIALSKHIVECKEKNRAPIVLQFTSAKNKNGNVLKISEIFKKAGLVSSSGISLQSLSAEALQAVDRKNISTAAYIEMQQQLRLKEINTYVELIWPLPGETLSSFQQGIEVLCQEGTNNIIVYSHVLLPNTPIYKNQKELGLIVHEYNFTDEKTDIIVQTNEVSYASFRAGCWFYFMVVALQNAQSFITLRAYLHENEHCSYATFFSTLAAYFKARPEHPITQTIEQLIDEGGMYRVDAVPTVYELVLHSQRDAFDELLHQFLSEQLWWEDENARLLFELDRLMKPCLFKDTPLREQFMEFEFIEVLKPSARVYTINFPNKFLSLIPSVAVENAGVDGGSSRFHISHNQGQISNRQGLPPSKRAAMLFGALWKVLGKKPKLVFDHSI